MLLRTLGLLLLSVSLALSATLGHYQSEEKKIEVPAADSEETDADVPTASHTTEKEDDTETTDGAGKQPQLPAELLKVDDPEDDSSEVETTDSVDESPVDVSVEDTDKPAGDMELTGKDLVQQEPHLSPIQANQSLRNSLTYDNDDRWSLNLIRNSFQTVHGYFDSLVELVGGHDGVCQYRCRYGDLPQPRPGYQLPEPNGCSSSLVGLQLNLGIPAMTNCCNLLDICYDTCGTNKYDCDSQFRYCLHDICADIKKSLGLGSKLQSCEGMADTLYNTLWTLGCRPYMNSQRAACVCQGEERDEL